MDKNIMGNNIKYQSAIKKNIIDLLMFSLYADARTIYREYVQNALDAINDAVARGILSKIKDGVVNISINTYDNSIIIRDNGTGIDVEHALARILNISASQKNGFTAAGQFGIGRLVGGGYCHKLIFRTSSKGESAATQITFNIDKIWKMVKEDPEEYLATEVIDSCIDIIRPVEKEELHYFEVQLFDVKKDMAATLLDKNAVIQYLNSVAPIDYKPEFKNIIIYKSTNEQSEYKDLHESLEKVQVFVNTERLEKQYGLKVEGTKDKIFNLEYFKIEDKDYGLLGWGWFAMTKFTIQIGKDDNLSCIRLRKHNIQIGDFDILSGKPLWKEERGNSYFYGEFFVTHPNIVPNAARDGLAPTAEKEALYYGLMEYFKKLHDLYSKANTAKKAIEKINEATKRIIQSKTVDRISKDLIENKGKAIFNKLVKNANFKPLLHMLELYRPSYEKAIQDVEHNKSLLVPFATHSEQNRNGKDLVDLAETNNSISEYSSRDQYTTESSQVKDQSILNMGSEDEKRDFVETPRVLSCSKEVTDGSAQRIIESFGIMQPLLSNDINNVDSPVKFPVTPTTGRLLKNDVLAPLRNKLEDDEIWILRRVFRVLNTYCPNNDHDQKLIEELEQLIVKDFENDN